VNGSAGASPLAAGSTDFFNAAADERGLAWLVEALAKTARVEAQHRRKLPLLELCQRSKELAAKARAGKATPDELSGGTFTISNMGMMDVESFGPIINPGESAILAVAITKPQPVVRDGKIVVRQMMKLTLSCDHRIVDGALGAKFTNAIKQKLEDLELWKRLAA
jgi:pyruvate/2-oxoglutarate dehydrogenase complex dihydrolipoamide acyltransferase (E2) component